LVALLANASALKIAKKTITGINALFFIKKLP